MGDPHADFCTSFVSHLANRSVLIDSEATGKESLSVAYKVFPKSIKERIKIDEVYVEKLPSPFYFFVLCTFKTFIYVIFFHVLHPIGCK